MSAGTGSWPEGRRPRRPAGLAEAARASCALKLSAANSSSHEDGGAPERQEALVFAVLAVSYELAALRVDTAATLERLRWRL